MATTTSNLPKGSLILVTGANGFVASHVVDPASLLVNRRARPPTQDR